MFIRRTQTRSSRSGEAYCTFRLVRSERVGPKVRQRTLLNLGRHFPVGQSAWPVLCRRIDEVLTGQLQLDPDCPPELEAHAQRIAAQLLARERAGAPAPAHEHDIQRVDVDSLELVRPRSVRASFKLGRTRWPVWQTISHRLIPLQASWKRSRVGDSAGAARSLKCCSACCGEPAGRWSSCSPRRSARSSFGPLHRDGSRGGSAARRPISQ